MRFRGVTLESQFLLVSPRSFGFTDARVQLIEQGSGSE